MRSPSPVLLAALLCGACATATSVEGAGPARHEFAEPLMGTVFRVVVHGDDPEAAGAAAEAAFARAAEIEAVASDYDPGSEARRLCASTGRRPVSDELAFLLARSAELSAWTRGAFDPTVGPLVRLWRRTERTGELPDPERIAEARALVGMDKVALDPEGPSAEVLVPGMRLDFGGLAKGYALDEMLAVLAEHGFASALVDGGGDLRVGAPPPGRDAWRVAAEPAAGMRVFLEVANAAVATSGDTARFVEVDGVHYSHVVDPRTGVAVGPVGATVVAREAWRADAAATACCVLGREGAELLGAEAGGGAEGRVVERRGGELRVWDTPGFAALVSSARSASRSEAPSEESAR